MVEHQVEDQCMVCFDFVDMHQFCEMCGCCDDCCKCTMKDYIEWQKEQDQS